jgi:hypothetical protein
LTFISGVAGYTSERLERKDLREKIREKRLERKD